MQHFILTRFNLRLWPHSKGGEETQTETWLRHRCDLFERYCLPSLVAQTCKDFTWVLLVDAASPAWLRERSVAWRQACPQMRLIGVQPEYSRLWSDIFAQVVQTAVKEQKGRLLSTYLDNDDALHRDFVADVQNQARTVPHCTFINFTYGLQYFTELGIATRVPYKYNHFNSYVEDYARPQDIKTVFGMGSHTLIHKVPGAQIVHVKRPEKPAWVEVVHERNKYNDVLMAVRTRLITDRNYMEQFYGWQGFLLAENSRSIFCTKFMVRAAGQVFRHVKHRLFGINWWG